jgi:hypothetical protein
MNGFEWIYLDTLILLGGRDSLSGVTLYAGLKYLAWIYLKILISR